MRLLVLGGSHFVGRAIVEAAVARGWSVTTFNRGLGDAPPLGVAQITGDRLVAADVERLREAGEWDLVADTWSGAPRAVRDSAGALADRAGRYLYVSSGSVYAPPPPVGAGEDTPVVGASPDAGATDYASDKRGAELAVQAAFGNRCVLARAGLILGPREDIGRLPWWLLRMERGGAVPVPGPPERKLQHVDARDLARWLLDAGAGEASGAFNVASRPGHATTASLLEACRAVTGGRAELTWASPAAVADAGVQPWVDLPCWLPEDDAFAGMLAMDVERAHGAGLQCRPVEDTVRDTWTWLVAAGRRPPVRDGVPPHGMAPEQEAALLAAARAEGSAAAD
ncbi:MAG TPA: NAD-dependent epimerase/dehydratase family protein [Baekduia sp.]|nr:NAD-dependent epimerase/dehydratase family protein [Baekduia sp.]